MLPHIIDLHVDMNLIEVVQRTPDQFVAYYEPTALLAWADQQGFTAADYSVGGWEQYDIAYLAPDFSDTKRGTVQVVTGDDDLAVFFKLWWG